MAIRIGIEGASAREAWRELSGIEGLRATPEPSLEEATKDFGTVVALGTLVALAADAFDVAERLAKWHRARKAEDSTLSVVVELPDGTRLSLDNATEDELLRIVRAAAKP